MHKEVSVHTAPSRALASKARDWRAVQWLTIGLGVKRWAFLVFLGVVLVVIGAAMASAYVGIDLDAQIQAAIALESLKVLGNSKLIDPVGLGVSALTMGALAIAVGVRGVLMAVERVYAGETKTNFLDTALKRRRLDNGERIVAMGGGTGLSTMLRGLKEYTSNITAIVTMADDGGSSGMLREHGVLPPGDLRNCIAALAEAEPLMTQLFQHRFEGMGPLKGHALGNLIVAALFEMSGDFDEAVRQTSKVLAIRGRVLPSTIADVRLGALLKDGTEVLGQVNVNASEGIEQVFLVPADPKALPTAVKAIQEAEMIIIGPGSLYTSIIPNLLVPEIAAAIKASHAPKIYVCNVMTQPNETLNYTAADHVRALIRHIGHGVITHVLLNSGKVSDAVMERYRASGAQYIVPEETEIEMLGVRAIHGPFIDVNQVVRHHPQRLAAAIFRIAARI